MDIYDFIICAGLVVVVWGLIVLAVQNRGKRDDDGQADASRRPASLYGDESNTFGWGAVYRVNVDGTPMMPGSLIDIHGKPFGDI